MKENNRVFLISASLFAGVIMVVSCYRPPVANPENWQYNFASIYNPGESAINPEYKLYHQSDTTSLLFFRISTDELIPNTQPDNSEPYKAVVVKYVLRNAENNQIADSASLLFRISATSTEREFITYLKLKTPLLSNYNLVVIFSDVLRKVPRRVFIDLNKSDYGNEQNYFFETADSVKAPLFSNVVEGNRKYIFYKKRSPADRYFVSYYTPISTIPQSPFAIQYNANLPSPDTIYAINPNDTLSFEAEGIYFISEKDSETEGVALTNFGQGYPEIRSVKNMILTIRYLTTERKWNEMLKSEDPKTEIDNFWLNLSSDPYRAKELIRVYYNRVILANRFFGTYKQGWQTDRGMIYIIFGPPATIYKSSDIEQWIYGDNPELSDISFSFKKSSNLLSGNEYILIRDQRYQTIWAQAIETWLQGRVFSIN